MRIDLNLGSGVQEAQAVKTEPRQESVKVSGGGASQAIGAEFETRVGLLAAKALAAPDVRDARVQELRVQIASGSYSVSERDLAESLLNQMRVAR